MMDIALLGMSQTTDLPIPVGRTAPDTVQTIMKFKNPEFILHWQTGRDFPGRPDHGTEFVSLTASLT